jgi:dTDP-4-dehydrorhamnose 3,5-epimerase
MILFRYPERLPDKMNIKESQRIKDLRTITPETFHDFRGEYVETFNAAKYIFHDSRGGLVEFVEDDISVSRRGVLRGLHGDDKTWKPVQCLFGAFYFVVVDMRTGSPTYLNWKSYTLNDRSRMQVLVPAGCANGHLVLTEQCIFSYKQSQYYSGMKGQFSLRWDDPRLNIYWPIRNPILSERDAFSEFIEV